MRRSRHPLADRRTLARIARRTERALSLGWIEEVEELVRLGYRDTRPMSSVGYRQVLAYVEGRLGRGELGSAIDRATSVFARRQRPGCAISQSSGSTPT
jgi:tRNA dimethylallyltransferase